MAAPAAANAAGGTYYPSGPQVNVPLSTVTNGGWVKCWSGLYSEHGTEAADIVAGTASGSVSACSGGNLMLTGWSNSDPSVLPVLAAAPAADVLGQTAPNAPRLSNGTYWYFTPGYSMGFSDTATVNQNNCDLAAVYQGGGDQNLRLCWHFPPNTSSTSLDAGWSLGPDVNDWSANTTRAIFKQLPSLHKGSKTNAGTLARLLKVTTPAGGSLVVSVSDASSGACSVSGNKLYAFGTGACEVTVTSLKANGDTKVSKSKTYVVN